MTNEQLIKHTIIDGHDGRTVANETNDCTVRALSLAFKVPYKEAHDAAARYGRKNRDGMVFEYFMNAQHGNIFGQPFEHKQLSPRMSIKTFLKRFATGTYICRIRKHVFCIEDGVVCDSYLPDVNKHVTDYWIIKGKQPGKIVQILELWKQGKSKKEIVALGFHRTTVNIQVNKFEK